MSSFKITLDSIAPTPAFWRKIGDTLLQLLILNSNIFIKHSNPSLIVKFKNVDNSRIVIGINIYLYGINTDPINIIPYILCKSCSFL